ncbi:ATP-dependent RNA helicase DDX42 [Trichoplax sp. H2]|nr:ATP-dependent RNA helicase DDX42 [Trichoplax sp. H2]|eukprot:RDD40177.1 ATP-dependent RNA helicase DDX42 [Trichoplax sp. H2]
MFNRNKLRFGLGQFRRQGDHRNEKDAKLPAKEMWPVSDVAMVSPATRRPNKDHDGNATVSNIIRPKDYFDESDDEDYSCTTAYKSKQDSKAQESDEEDPLDAFMAELKEGGKEETTTVTEENKKSTKGTRDDIEEEDDHESYFKYMKDHPLQNIYDEDEEIQYDDDGNPLPPKKKIIDPLPPIDHSTIEYLPFEKYFYERHEDISKLNAVEVTKLRLKLGIKVTGAQPPCPCISFAHYGFDERLMGVIRKSEYASPTPIQAQAVPIALSGRDIIGIAKTGSGKTAAFLWPMLVHIMDQPPLKYGDGPIGLICAPTRELCQQIYAEAKRFGKCFNLKACAVFGGGSKWEQTKSLQEGAEIVVATPGRLIDIIKAKATNLQRVTYLVFDEADRMFDMGFEPQVRSVASHVRPDRQTLLFSATFKKKVEYLARDILTDPIRVVIGDIGEANEDVTQHVRIFKDGAEKWKWLNDHLIEFSSAGSVLIFVTKKSNSEELANNLKSRDIDVGLLHGDINQFDRNKIINSFKKKELAILVATDVAARGLDIPSIKNVINYDVARDITTHTHRIGRTGRAGEKGTAYTLLTAKDKSFSGDLVRNLEGANQEVPAELMEMAMENPWFRKTRFKQGKQQGRKARPGLGMHTEASKKGHSSRPSFATSFVSAKSDTGFNMPATNSDSTEASKKVHSSRSSYATSFVSAKSDTGFNVPTTNNDSNNQKSDDSTSGSVFADIASSRKATMQAQYQMRFCKATTTSWPLQSTSVRSTETDNDQKEKVERVEAPRKKKSRWD